MHLGLYKFMIYWPIKFTKSLNWWQYSEHFTSKLRKKITSLLGIVVHSAGQNETFSNSLIGKTHFVIIADSAALDFSTIWKIYFISTWFSDAPRWPMFTKSYPSRSFVFHNWTRVDMCWASNCKTCNRLMKIYLVVRSESIGVKFGNPQCGKKESILSWK